MANNIMDLLQRAMMGQDTQEITPPLDPNAVQEAESGAEIAQVNEEAKSPNLMTKPELVQSEIQKEAQTTVPGQLQDRKVASEVSNPVETVSKATEAGIPQNVQELLKQRNELDARSQRDVAKARKADANTEMMANIIKALGSVGQSEIQRNAGVDLGLKGFEPAAKVDTASQLQKDADGRMKKLQADFEMLKALRAEQDKGKMTEYQKAQLASADKDRALKEKLASGKTSKKPTEFSKALEKKQAADFADSQAGLEKTSKAISAVDDALNSQLGYSKDKIGGTGPLSTGFGLTKYLSEDTEALDAKFKAIDLKNMVSTFSGMSKAVDSDAERRAWKATQASVANDDETNVQILLGSKSSLLKDKAIANAKADWVEQNGNLDGFTHPILEGKVTTMVDPSGEMILVDKAQVPELKQQGLTDVDTHAKSLLEGKKPESEFVTMIAPNGQEARVKRDKVDAYLKKGATIKE